MATSSLCNFLSFLLPSQQKTQTLKSPPSQLAPPSSSSISSPSTLSYQEKNRNGFVPVMSSYESNPSSSNSVVNDELLSVVCPSLAYSNTLFFKTAYNVQVVVDEDEPEEVLLRRFKREVFRAGVINECKRRRFFENKQEEKKRKHKEAAKRNRRRRPFVQRPDKQEMASSEKEKRAKEDDEDNWELPKGNIPY
ncbi:hypothetical protein MKW98_002371 [Papaver atlanticum]|uniref:Ribosomal protein S21 n=1 Tax=Papaver atlanticum TaxID=357466 RepID=A0AAD4SA13_9MAGN|nr:hypothetical protein MKW98_002371 [Papaver atlanticum]